MKLNYRFLLLAIFAILVSFKALPVNISTWCLTHWLFTYKYGFIKRGLIGTLVSTFNPSPSFNSLVVCSVIVNAILLFALLVYTAPMLRDNSNAWFLFLLLFFGSSAVQNFSYDIGRFDQFGLLILLVALVILKNKPAFQCLIIPLCALGILIHESFFLAFFPFILAATLHKKQNHLALTLTFFVLIVFSLAMVFGGASIDESSYTTALASKTDFAPVDLSIATLYWRLKDNVAYSIGSLFNKETLIYHVWLLLWQLPVLMGLCAVIRSVYMTARQLKETYSFALLFACSLSPLALYPVGKDFYRWIALAMTNLFLLTIFLSTKDEYYCKIEKAATQYNLLIVIALFTSIIVGPMGITSALPQFLL